MLDENYESKRVAYSRGPHQYLSDFLYSGSTNENQFILFCFQLYALEQRISMVLKLFYIMKIIFWLKYLCFLNTPICVFFKFRSIFGNKLFFDPI